MVFKIKHLNEILIKINKTPFYAAVENENIDIIELLLMNKNVDINKLCFFVNIFYLFITS